MVKRFVPETHIDVPRWRLRFPKLVEETRLTTAGWVTTREFRHWPPVTCSACGEPVANDEPYLHATYGGAKVHQGCRQRGAA